MGGTGLLVEEEDGERGRGEEEGKMNAGKKERRWWETSYRLRMLIPQSREGRDKVEPRSSWRRCLRCSPLDRYSSQRISSLKGESKTKRKTSGTFRWRRKQKKEWIITWIAKDFNSRLNLRHTRRDSFALCHHSKKNEWIIGDHSGGEWGSREKREIKRGKEHTNQVVKILCHQPLKKFCPVKQTLRWRQGHESTQCSKTTWCSIKKKTKRERRIKNQWRSRTRSWD